MQHFLGSEVLVDQSKLVYLLRDESNIAWIFSNKSRDKIQSNKEWMFLIHKT